MEFWKTKEGKILSQGIHDINGAIALIGAYLSFIKYETVTREETLEYVDKISKNLTKINDASDYMYTGIKTLVQNDNIERR